MNNYILTSKGYLLSENDSSDDEPVVFVKKYPQVSESEKDAFDREKKLIDCSQKGESAEVNFESVIESPPLSPVNNKELVEKVRRVD